MDNTELNASDRPIAVAVVVNPFDEAPPEHPVTTWTKIIFLILGTYGLMVAMWIIW
jgi:hypothetical protein